MSLAEAGFQSGLMLMLVSASVFAGPAGDSSPAKTLQAVNKKLPDFCRDDDLKGGPKKIYRNKELTKVDRDMDSSGMIFSPAKELLVGGKTVYQGSVSSILNGRDAPGVFYIDPKEWGALCK